jgi:hypothetical protein
VLTVACKLLLLQLQLLLKLLLLLLLLLIQLLSESVGTQMQAQGQGEKQRKRDKDRDDQRRFPTRARQHSSMHIAGITNRSMCVRASESTPRGKGDGMTEPEQPTTALGRDHRGLHPQGPCLHPTQECHECLHPTQYCHGRRKPTPEPPGNLARGPTARFQPDHIIGM